MTDRKQEAEQLYPYQPLKTFPGPVTFGVHKAQVDELRAAYLAACEKLEGENEKFAVGFVEWVCEEMHFSSRRGLWFYGEEGFTTKELIPKYKEFLKNCHPKTQQP